MDYEYEDMEVEYTHPQHLLNSHYDSNLFEFPSKGTFSIPSSFFEDTYKKSTIVTNAVCSLLDKFTLDDQEQIIKTTTVDSPPLSPTTEKEKITTTNENDQSLVLNSIEQDISKKQLIPEPIQLKTVPETIEESKNQEPLQQTDIKLTSQNTSFYSNTNHQEEKQQSQSSYQQIQPSTPLQTYPSHTFIYQAPANTPIDPISHSQGAIYYISGIIKLIFKIIIFIGLLYILSHIVSNFHHDMKAKIAMYESDQLSDQVYCQQQYESNRCTPDTRLPAVKDLCRGWERCMLRPISVSKTKVMGEVIAELFNGFVNTLSTRTLLYTIFIGLGLIWSITSAFSQEKLIKKHETSSITHNSHLQLEGNNKIPNKSIKKLELQPYL